MTQRDGTIAAKPHVAWRKTAGEVSLPEVHRSIAVPTTASFWRKLAAFSGPGFLVAVGYMDPGNWATDLAGGARFGYSLLAVIMISTSGGCFAAELIFSKPRPTGILLGFIPNPGIVAKQEMLYVSIGILGATVMPHNLYLHSSIVQTRKFEQTPEGRREAVKSATIDSSAALMFALFVNSAILILAAAVFHWSGHQEVAEIQDAYKLLSPLLGVGVASALFAVALLASGQNSTLTGTLAGQIVMEGFLNFRITPWLRRLITRLIAIVPAVFIIGIFGEGKTTELLVASQVVLSMQLGFAVWPLLWFTGKKAKMGEFANRLWVKILGWTAAGIIIVLNVKLLFDIFIPDAVRKAFYGFIGLPMPE